MSRGSVEDASGASVEIHVRLSCGPRTCLALAVAIASGVAPAPIRAQVIASVTGGPALVRSVGNRESAWQLGGGVEAVGAVYGFGGEVHYVYFPEVTRTFEGRVVSSSPAVSTAALTAKGSYYFGGDAPGRRLRPFVTGGLSYLFDDELPLIMVHVGGGVDWWTTRRAGIRLEIREQFASILSFRAGVIFQ